MQPWRNDRQQDTRKGSRVSAAAVVLSIALHLTLILSHLAAPEGFMMREPEKEPIELTQVPPEMADQQLKKKVPPKQPKTVEKRMAETEEAKKAEEDPDARFLSDKNQKAEKETRAKMVDDFRTKTGTGSKQLIPQENAYIPPTGEENVKDGGQKAKDAVIVADDGEQKNAGEGDKKAGVKRNWKTLSLKDLSLGGDGGALAATDDHLDDVLTADRTILSTREFRYFSYYQRIKDLLRQYWKPKVEQKLMHLWGRGKTVSEEEMTTKILVLLDPRGTIQKISRVGSSGVSELDDAAVEAFERAAPFPNPPKGIIEPDGYVRIRWDFILKTESAPRIQFAPPGAGTGTGGNGKGTPF